MSNLVRKKISENITFNSLDESRFKTVRASACFYLPLSYETAAQYAVLSQVLSRSCREYPDFTVLSKKLFSLYGASLYVSVRKVGDVQELVFSMSGIDDRFALSEEKMSKELSDLLCEIIFEPKLVDGNAFDTAELEQERRQIIDQIDSEYSDKRVYASNQAIKIMCKDEPFGLSRLGDKDSVNAVSEKSLYEAWKKMLSDSRVEIIFIGQGDKEAVFDTFKKRFSNVNRTPTSLKTTVIKSADKINSEDEQMDLSQSKLIMGFRTSTAEPDEDVMATRLMCAVLGGTAHSKLFSNVREKMSLCYYCSSRYNRQKGILTIESGVEKENIEKTKSAVLEQIEAIKNADVTDFELECAKLSMANEFKSICDTASGLQFWYDTQMLDSQIYSPQKASELVQAVTKADVIAAAKRLTLDTVYTLIGTQN